MSNTCLSARSGRRATLPGRCSKFPYLRAHGYGQGRTGVLTLDAALIFQVYLRLKEMGAHFAFLCVGATSSEGQAILHRCYLVQAPLAVVEELFGIDLFNNICTSNIRVL